MTDQAIEDFQQTVWRYYDEHGRHDLPWRLPDADGRFDPYKIMVSEVMLQQTQVNRVIPKYLQFLELFPQVDTLAQASLGEVLIAWQGLGYNRRAKFLWQAAQKVVSEYDGRFPRSQQELVGLPGIGMNTAGAIVAYAYDEPTSFIETNIRTVFIHHFFDDQTGIADKTIHDLVAASLPKADAGEAASFRNWYWALMDYGAHLKQTVGNKSRASKSYVRQSPFHGSRRQVRGAVIRELGKRPAAYDALLATVSDPRLEAVLQDLVREELIRNDAGTYRLA